jgi:hypothetical protein
MRKFVFYRVSDKTQEPITKILADDEYRATQIFAGMKRLSIEEFNKLYKIKEERTYGHSY